MTRGKARARLFAALALSLFVFIQQPFLARASYRCIAWLGTRYEGLASFVWQMVEDRWILTACLLLAVYYAYRLAAAPPNAGWRRGGGGG